MKVKVQNYQSIKDAEIDVRGFTVVVGRTNVGKSALVRAIKGLLTNQGGNHFIHQGKGVVRVELNDGDQVDVVWQKGKGVNQYTLNGDKFSSVSRGRPDFLDGLGFGELVSGSDRVVPQVADQQDSSRPFLLDKSGSFIAEAICSVTGIERVNPAIRIGEKRLRDLKSQLKVRKEDLVTAQNDLAVYGGLDNALQAVAEAKDGWKTIQDDRREYKVLQDQQKALLALSSSVEVLSGVEDLVIPDAVGIESLQDEIEEISGFLLLWMRGLDSIVKLTGVDEFEVPDSEDFRGSYQKIVDLEAFCHRWKNSQMMLLAVDGINDLNVPDLDSVLQAADEFQQLTSWVDKIRMLEGDIKSIADDFTDWEDSTHQCEEEWTAALGDVCPLCGRGET